MTDQTTVPRVGDEGVAQGRFCTVLAVAFANPAPVLFLAPHAPFERERFWALLSEWAPLRGDANAE